MLSVTIRNYPLDPAALSILKISEDYIKEVEGKINTGEFLLM